MAAGGLQAEAALVAAVDSSGEGEGSDWEVRRCEVRKRAAPAIYRRGKAVSRPGLRTQSSCLPVNGSSGSLAGGIRGGE
jgi:hypothetical protein